MMYGHCQNPKKYRFGAQESRELTGKYPQATGVRGWGFGHLQVYTRRANES